MRNKKGASHIRCSLCGRKIQLYRIRSGKSS
ncbi:MAG: hypothetical protein IJD91_05205 [Clostridia bacterium]|nr:hypothetical protein [Clostridia bacterium]